MASIFCFLVLCFVCFVFGIYKTGHFNYIEHVRNSNRLPAIKETLVLDDVDGVLFCAVHCLGHPECQAIEICPQINQHLCRLYNITNPYFSGNVTDSCQQLQLTANCGKPNVKIDNAAIAVVYNESEYSLTGVGARRIVRCKDSPLIETSMVCLSNGSWSEPDIRCPECSSLTCSSHNHSYTLCDAGGHILSVSLTEQHSFSACTENYSFGIIGKNIWMDNGCRATFKVCLEV